MGKHSNKAQKKKREDRLKKQRAEEAQALAEQLEKQAKQAAKEEKFIRNAIHAEPTGGNAEDEHSEAETTWDSSYDPEFSPSEQCRKMIWNRMQAQSGVLKQSFIVSHTAKKGHTMAYNVIKELKGARYDMHNLPEFQLRDLQHVYETTAQEIDKTIRLTEKTRDGKLEVLKEEYAHHPRTHEEDSAFEIYLSTFPQKCIDSTFAETGYYTDLLANDLHVWAKNLEYMEKCLHDSHCYKNQLDWISTFTSKTIGKEFPKPKVDDTTLKNLSN